MTKLKEMAEEYITNTKGCCRRCSKDAYKAGALAALESSAVQDLVTQLESFANRKKPPHWTDILHMQADIQAALAALAYEKRKAEVGGTWNDYSHGFEDGWRIALAELLPVIGSMDCRGDEDCDHCVGLRLIRGKRKGG